MIPPAVLKRLERFPAREALALTQWLQDNPVGTNLALHLLELLEDLSKKETRPATDFFEDIPSGEQLQSKERGRLWRDSLERRLHPHLKAHAASFMVQLRKLGLPEGLEIEPPQNFEGRNFTLRISFSDKGELRRRLQALESSLEAKEWDRLWDY